MTEAGLIAIVGMICLAVVIVVGLIFMNEPWD